MRFCFAFILIHTIQLTFAQPSDTNFFVRVNSSYDELNPVISPDGKLLFLTVANHPQNIGGKKDLGDIWISVLTGMEWSTPIHAGSLLNDKAYNAVAGFSADGSQLFLLGHYNDPGKTLTQGISVSKIDGNGWSKPENISIPFFQNKSSTLSGYVTPDKGVFIFSAETYGTKGVEDIYVSLNEDGRWTEAKNLGNKINTPFQEVSPFLSPDGKTVYFSSNGRKGKGSFDVYSSTRLDDSWTNWSEPVNLGTNINTEGRELFYRLYPGLAFALFTTTKNSDGYGDIKIHRAGDPPLKKDSALVISTKPDSLTRMVEAGHEKTVGMNKFVTVYGKVSNSKTAEPIQAVLNFSAPGFDNTVQATSADGFSIQISSTEVYTIRIEAGGYVSTIEKLDIHTYEMNELELNFKLQPIEIGARINLKSVLFERGTARLLPESDPELDVVVSFLKSNPKIKIELAGHTDNRGVRSDNVRLSQQRVNKVKEYLVSRGIDAKRIAGKGYGGSKPIASNETEDTRKLNRRVEFTIKKF